MNSSISRRKFLGQASCAAVGTSTFFNTLLNLCMTNTAAAKPAFFNNDYKALVCVLFAGGMDSFNMLVPRGVPEYFEYHLARTSLSLPIESLLPIKQKTTNLSRNFGLHPSLSGVQNLFNEENLAFITNVGTLHEPVNLTEYKNGTKKLPLGLFSHSDQIMQWQTSIPRDRQAVGFGGRLADILSETCFNSNISMNISLGGRNFFQSGKTTSEYAIRNSGTGSIGIDGYMGSGLIDALKTSAIDNILDAEYRNLFRCTYADVIRDSQDNHEEFSAAIGMVNDGTITSLNPSFSTLFSPTGFSANLQMIAKTIAARNKLNMNRQIFYLVFGGWDHHDEVLNNQLRMLKIVNDGLVEFYDAIQQMGVEKDVTLFTISDFARTLTSNGNGSDHAWGGNHLVMGGAVKGKEIYGTFPDLAIGSNLDVGRGRLIPTTSTDQYFLELAKWFGVSSSDLGMILPNIGNFSGLPNLEFME